MSVPLAATDQSTRKRQPRTRLPTFLSVWDIALAAALVLVLVLASVLTPNFMTGLNFSITAASALGICLMVIPMAWLMIAGEIDLSIASIFALASTIFGLALEHGLGLVVACTLGIAVGAVAGLINGLLVDLGLPSLIVTVGTLGLYRGLSFILLQNRGISTLPTEFTDFAQNNLPGTAIPFGFAAFLVIAAVSALLLHRGAIGRKALAVGSSPEVSRYSGLRVRRVKRGLFIFSGVMAAGAGILYSGYISTVRATNGTGLELIVIGIVLIGGVNMYGGKGSFIGVFLSLSLVTTLTSWMTLQNITTDIQYMVTGALMISAVVVPALTARAHSFRVRRTNRTSERPPNASAGRTSTTTERRNHVPS